MSEVQIRKASEGESLRDLRGSTVTTSDSDYVLTERDGSEVVLSGDAVKAIQGAKVNDAPSNDGPAVTAVSPTGKGK